MSEESLKAYENAKKSELLNTPLSCKNFIKLRPASASMKKNEKNLT